MIRAKLAGPPAAIRSLFDGISATLAVPKPPVWPDDALPACLWMGNLRVSVLLAPARAARDAGIDAGSGLSTPAQTATPEGADVLIDLHGSTDGVALLATAAALLPIAGEAIGDVIGLPDDAELSVAWG